MDIAHLHHKNRRCFRIFLVVMTAFATRFADAVPPTVQPFSFPSEVIKGQTVTVICAVLDGTGPFVFRWAKDGNPVHDHSLTRIQTSEEFSLLSLKMLDRTRTGNYSCTVSNEEGSGRHTAELTVYEQPEWTIIPSDVEVILGDSTRIDCSAVGVPEPQIIWKKAGESGANQATSSSRRVVQYQAASNGSLILMNAREEDQGEYECTATNGIGEEISSSATVRVHVPPQFREEFELIKVRSSHSISLPCEVTGDSPLEVRWSREYMTEGYEKRQKVQETPLPNGLLSELFITRASRADAGIYLCTAANPYGKRQRTVKLVVLEPPLPPSDITVKHVGSYEVTIRWVAPYSGNSPVTRYVLQYWKDTGAPPKLEELAVPSDQTTIVLTGLLPGTGYVVRLVAENEFGQSAPSMPVKFATAEESPTGYPMDIIAMSSGSHALLIRWKPPPHEQRNGIIRGYDLGYRERRTSRTYSYKEVVHVEDESNGDEDYQEYLLEDLESGTEYEVVLRAYNSAGKGPLSVPVAAKTRNEGFLTPPHLWLESATSNSISLRWSNNESKAKNSYYRISYRIADGIWKDKVIKNKDQESYVFTDLQQGTEYEIFIQTVSGMEHSNPSATLRVSTTSDPSSLRSSMLKEEDDLAAPSLRGPAATTATLVISLSVVTSAVVIVCIITAACVYVVRVRSRAQYKAEDNCSRRLSEQRSTSEIGRMSQSANFRYVDVNARPLMWCSTPAPPPNEYPSPYATLPLRGTPLSKRWQSEGDGLTPAQSERSESLVNQRLDQVEEKTPSCHD